MYCGRAFLHFPGIEFLTH
uniref:Uncharacterized protein n=1 Tax=Rhizophora mucronata TaxID=61149 RepID=A0A2P2ITM6_RHIMU